jgi:hypothetical protein
LGSVFACAVIAGSISPYVSPFCHLAHATGPPTCKIKISFIANFSMFTTFSAEGQQNLLHRSMRTGQNYPRTAASLSGDASDQTDEPSVLCEIGRAVLAICAVDFLAKRVILSS